MNRKVKFNLFVTEDEVQGILEDKFPDKECPDCHEKSLCIGYIEKQYYEKIDKHIVLSFDIFCESCGALATKWDNTNRHFYFTE